MFWRFPYNPGPYDDDYEDQPAQGPFYQWGLGGVLPIALLWYGGTIAITRLATVGRYNNLTLHDTNAQVYGGVPIALGLFLHCHYFWGNIYNQAWFAVLGKIIFAIAFIAGLVTLCIRVGIFGIT